MDDIESLPASRFIAYAERLTAYQGAVRAVVEEARQELTGSKQTASNASEQTSQKVQHFSDVKFNPELSQYFD